MAFRRRMRSYRRRAGGFANRKLTSARRTASKHRNKAKMLSTVAMALGGFLVYDKFFKQS